MRVAVIGAGPSGLVTLKYLLHAQKTLNCGQPIEARIFESVNDVGGTFSARVYEDAELVSSRQLTSFSDFRCDNNAPDFLSASDYVEYLRRYCDHFELWPHMSFGCTVQSVTRGEGGAGYLVTYGSIDGLRQVWRCDAVAVCSGLHVTPSIPTLAGADRIPVRLHSSELKQRAQFGVDTTVLVVGSGETGADVAYLAVTSQAKRVVLSHRDGFHLAPKRNPLPRLIFSRARDNATERPQLPIDVSRASLFDTAYVHEWLRNSDVLWKYYTAYLKWISWVSWGTPHGHNQWVGEKPEGWSASEIFFNKAGHKISPFMADRWRPKTPTSLIGRLRSLVVVEDIQSHERGEEGRGSQTTDEPTRSRCIDVAPWPERVDEDGVVHFRNNGRPEYHAILQDAKENGGVKPDVIVFCTGYRQEFTFLSGLAAGARDSEKPPRAPAPLSFEDTDVRGIWKSSEPGIGFIGFVRPNLGAIPPLAEMQAQLWVLNLVNTTAAAAATTTTNGIAIKRPSLLQPQLVPMPHLDPEDEHHYRLHSHARSRIGYGVDHESYMYQLALDMGSAPSFTEVLGMSWAMTRRRGQQKLTSPSRWWKLPLTCFLGAHVTPKFRLRGPWRWDGAVDVMTGDEVWDTVARREIFFGHITLSVIPMLIFGPLSLLVYLFASLVHVLERVTGIDVLHLSKSKTRLEYSKI